MDRFKIARTLSVFQKVKRKTLFLVYYFSAALIRRIFVSIDCSFCYVCYHCLPLLGRIFFANCFLFIGIYKMRTDTVLSRKSKATQKRQPYNNLSNFLYSHSHPKDAMFQFSRNDTMLSFGE